MVTIQDKMRCAGVAYQHFLIAIKTDQDCIDQARVVFEQHFDVMVLQLRSIAGAASDENVDLLNIRLDLHARIQAFSDQFECFYLGAFKQFKQQNLALIDKDSKMAFNNWLEMFDSEYLKFLRQESVCREYAEILVDITQLAQQLQTTDQVAQCDNN